MNRESFLKVNIKMDMTGCVQRYTGDCSDDLGSDRGSHIFSQTVDLALSADYIAKIKESEEREKKRFFLEC